MGSQVFGNLKKSISGAHAAEDVSNCMARFIRAKTNDYPQLLNVSSKIRWLCSISLQKSRLWGLRPALVLTKSRRRAVL